MNAKPNVLMLIIDPGRADHFSCYGYEKNTTPNIDKIAAEGVLYREAISASPWTVPSHASIFSGLFPMQHGAGHGHTYLDKSIPTMAELLKEAGYSTVGISNNPWVSYATGLDRGFERLYGASAKSKTGFFFKRLSKRFIKLISTNDSGATISNLQAKRWLRQNYLNPSNKKPFFMFINYLETHLPYQPPSQYHRKFVDGKTDSKNLRGFDQNTFEKYLAGKVELTQNDFKTLSALYDAELAYLDSRIGQLVDFLRQKDLLENTMLIITSDHGENLGEHGLLDHQYCLYDTLLRVPMIIRHPKLFTPGTTVSSQVQTTDILPTLSKVAGFNTADLELPGHTLVPAEIKSGRFAFAEFEKPTEPLTKLAKKYPDFNSTQFNKSLKMIRSKKYKYILDSEGGEEFYNIATDPEERENALTAFPKEVDEHRSQLKAWASSFKTKDSKNQDPYEVDENTKKLLKGLGYLG